MWQMLELTMDMSIYLVKNNLSPAGIAMDVNKGPLEKAQEHIREEKLGGKIATRLEMDLHH